MNAELFEQGYQHGLVSNALIDFRLSFRMGFRKAKLELRELRRKQGVVELGIPIKFKSSSTYN